MNPEGGDGNFTHYHLTDHQFSTVALIDNAANLLERVTYDAYGNARHHWTADITGDGAVGRADQTAMRDADRSSIGQVDYNVDADISRTGTVGSNDVTWTTTSNFKAALPKGVLSAPEVGNTIGYAGYVFNAEIPAGLYTVRFRHYDPGLGRWLDRDPLGYVDGMSLYGYGIGNPLSGNDPFGLAWWNPWSWGKEDQEWDDMMRENQELLKDRIKEQVENGNMTEEEAGAFIVNMEEGLNEVVDELGRIRLAAQIQVVATAISIIVPGAAYVRMAMYARGATTYVIGAGMQARVIPFARHFGYSYYKPILRFVPWGVLKAVSPRAAKKLERLGMRLNARWARQRLRHGDRVIDIGPSNTSSPWLRMERDILQNSPNYTCPARGIVKHDVSKSLECYPFEEADQCYRVTILWPNVRATRLSDNRIAA